MKKETIEQKYDHLLASAKSQRRYDFSNTDRVYAVFVHTLYELKLDPFDDIGIVERAIEDWLKYIVDKNPAKASFGDFNAHLNTNLAINRHQHFLVFPLVDSGCAVDIVGETFQIITGDPGQKIAKLTSLCGISIGEANSFAEHTEQNKAPGFFDHNLLVVPQQAHTSAVRFRATELMRLVLYVIRMFYLGYSRGLDIDTTPRFRISSLSASKLGRSPSDTIAIWADEYHSFAHLSLHSPVSMSFDLDFIVRSLGEIDSFIRNIVLNINRNDFGERILNAVVLGNKAYQLEKQREPNLSLLVLLSTIESLLCENRNEKKLRLAALLPRFAGVEPTEVSKRARELAILYDSRNQFVHAAEQQNIDLLLGKESVAPLVLVSRLLARLIFSNVDVTNQTTLRDWNERVNDAFEGLVF